MELSMIRLQHTLHNTHSQSLFIVRETIAKTQWFDVQCGEDEQPKSDNNVPKMT